MSAENYYYQLLDNETLQQETGKLMQAYQAAINEDLPFEKTKEIYLRLKQIKKQLDVIQQNNNTLQSKFSDFSQ